MNNSCTGTCQANQTLQKGTVGQGRGVYSLRVAYNASDCYATVDTSMETAFGFYRDYG